MGLQMITSGFLLYPILVMETGMKFLSDTSGAGPSTLRDPIQQRTERVSRLQAQKRNEEVQRLHQEQGDQPNAIQAGLQRGAQIPGDALGAGPSTSRDTIQKRTERAARLRAQERNEEVQRLLQQQRDQQQPNANQAEAGALLRETETRYKVVNDQVLFQ